MNKLAEFGNTFIITDYVTISKLFYVERSYIMSIKLNDSVTKVNLMRAFAGESQARNRYVFAASQALKEGKHVISAVFGYTASQEEAHAKVFYNHLKELAGEKIIIEEASYPVNISTDLIELLENARENEYEEHEPVYRQFGDTAKQEGYPAIANTFYKIAEIEKVHGDRFGRLADLLKQGKLFVSDVEEEWICLNCGYIHKGLEAPQICPVCSHDQGFFIRFSMSPYED